MNSCDTLVHKYFCLQTTWQIFGFFWVNSSLGDKSDCSHLSDINTDVLIFSKTVEQNHRILPPHWGCTLCSCGCCGYHLMHSHYCQLTDGGSDCSPWCRSPVDVYPSAIATLTVSSNYNRCCMLMFTCV